MNRLFWNVTYNDPGRWRDVYAISGPRLGWFQGIRATFGGFAVGSPKLKLERIDGIAELQAMRDPLNDRTDINFLRTKGGLIAFTKVRLEVYAIPFRNAEWQIEHHADTANHARLDVLIQRENESMRLVMVGAPSTASRMLRWLDRVARADL